MTIKTIPAGGFGASARVVVVGAGAAGFCAALSLHEVGVEVVVLERDSLPRGSTALSAGLVPASRTRFQKTLGIEDSPALFAFDIQHKAQGDADAAIVDIVTRESGPAVEWLGDRYGFPFSVVHDSTIPAIRRDGCMACRAVPVSS